MNKRKSKLNRELEKLHKEDVFSLVFFALYKIKDIPEYSTLSELSYVLDDKALLNFLDYYGGKTITIPTTREFKLVLDALLLYNYVRLENKDFEEAVNLLDKKDYKIKEIKDCYIKICEVLDKYNFVREK